jgi:hypothetical protein
MRIRGFAYGGLVLATLAPPFNHDERDEPPHVHEEQCEAVQPWGRLTYISVATTSSST